MIRLTVLHKGKATRVNPSEASLHHAYKKELKCWIDLDRPTIEEIKLVSKIFKLHPLVEEDMTTKGTRVKVEYYHDYLFFVGYGLFHEHDFNLHEFDYALGKHFLISAHHVQERDYDKLLANMDLVYEKLNVGSDKLFHRLVDILIDNYDPVLEKLEDVVEDLEEEATTNADSNMVAKILKLKRKIVQIRRVTFSIREQVGHLTKEDHPYISHAVSQYFRDVYDHAIRVSDRVDSYREIIAGAYEAYMSTLSNKMNEIMKVLSIIGTIMMPLTFLTGIYGMNFHVMPGLDNPNAFWIMVIGMIALSVMMMVFFKSRKWL